MSKLINSKKFLSLKTVSNIYDVKLGTLQKMCLLGKIPAYKFGKKWYVKPQDIDNLFESGKNTEAIEVYRKVIKKE